MRLNAYPLLKLIFRSFKPLMTMRTITQPIAYQGFSAIEFEEQALNEFIVELVDGEIAARNYPTASHQRPLFELTILIGSHLKANQLMN